MPRLLSPYENTANAARLNASKQITRRQFEMLTEPERPVTRKQVRQLRLLVLVLGGSFAAWGSLYWLAREHQAISFDFIILCGGVLLIVNGSIMVLAILRLLYGILAITPTSEEIGEAIRKRIRQGNLEIASIEGRIKFPHLMIGRRAMLCSVVVGRREFPVSQALWEVLQERARGTHWTVFFLREPSAPLSIIPTRDLEHLAQALSTDEEVVSGNTIPRRVDA